MNRLKALRKRANITLRQLEKYVCIRNATLSLIENEKQPFREIHIQKLTSFFDVSSDYLLGYSHIGIGIYFEDEHAVISDSELRKIEEKNEVKEQLIKMPFPHKMDIVTPNTQKTIVETVYAVFRSVDIQKAEASVNRSVRERLDKELDRLDTNDLEKVLKFVNEYIK